MINDYGKIYICSLSPHQDLYQKLIECFSNFIPLKTIQNILDKEDLELIIEKKVKEENFEKTETETCESIAELEYPQEYNVDIPTLNILDDLNGEKINDLKVHETLNDLDIVAYLSL